MSDSSVFALRPLVKEPELPRSDEAFRVYFSSKDLQVYSLQTGQLIQLTSEDDSEVRGIGIAWPASDRKENHKYLTVTSTLREAYGFTLQQKVRISKSHSELPRADVVIVSFAGNNKDKDHIAHFSEDEIRGFVASALDKLDIVPAHTIVKVEFRKSGLRQSVPYLVEKVVPRDDPTKLWHKPSWPVQTEYNRTKIILSGYEITDQITSSDFSLHELSADGLGGLQSQVKRLNHRLSEFQTLIRRSKQLPSPVRLGYAGILLYGPSGTGKSMLLDKVAGAGWKTVHRVDPVAQVLSAPQWQTKISQIFSQALASQPSLIIINKIDRLAPKTDNDALSSPDLAGTISTEMANIRGTRILVCAACSSLAKLNQRLRSMGLFKDEIEVPVPDASARIDILSTLTQHDAALDGVCQEVGLRTHGYVGRDLTGLCHAAYMTAIQRQELSSDPEAPAIPSLADFETALRDVRPSAMKEIFLETPRVFWNDIGGSERVREELAKVTTRPFRNAEMVAKLRLRPHRGILLYGPPGCSKTLCAKAVATESGLNFLAVKGAELLNMYVGETERKIREIFAKARAASPSIIFFDEIETIASSRAGNEHSGLHTMTTLLNEMDGIEALNNVLVLAATNSPEALAPALLRPGRFDAKIYVGLPNLDARKQIITIANRGRPIDGVAIKLNDLATQLEGYTGAEITEVCNAAASALADEIEAAASLKASSDAVGDGKSLEKITQRHYDRALEVVERGVSSEMVDRYLSWKASDNRI